MTTPSVTLVGDVVLTAVQRIEHALDGGFASMSIPGLDGDVLQRAGRGSHGIRLSGALTGDTASDDLATLQALATEGAETTFSADISTALELQKVVVGAYRAVATAGYEDLVTYDLWLLESPVLPPPAEVSGFGFGGLDDFGVGDLGFDTDIMGDLASLADQVAGAVDQVMAAADQLAALASLSGLDVGGPLQPLSDAVSSVTAGASTFESVSATIGALLGGTP